MTSQPTLKTLPLKKAPVSLNPSLSNKPPSHFCSLFWQNPLQELCIIQFPFPLFLFFFLNSFLSDFHCYHSSKTHVVKDMHPFVNFQSSSSLTSWNHLKQLIILLPSKVSSLELLHTVDFHIFIFQPRPLPTLDSHEPTSHSTSPLDWQRTLQNW